VTREEIGTLLTRRRQAFERQNAVALADLYSDTCVVESPTAGGAVTGRIAIAGVYDAWFKAFPDVTMTFEDPLIDGDKVVQTIISVGTDTGRFLGLPATGKPFQVRCVFVSTAQDSLIVQEQRIYDFTGMLVQIGVLKARSA
jgi:steroid delta-isomerase-like uncharacterized protein